MSKVDRLMNEMNDKHRAGAYMSKLFNFGDSTELAAQYIASMVAIGGLGPNDILQFIGQAFTRAAELEENDYEGVWPELLAGGPPVEIPEEAMLRSIQATFNDIDDIVAAAKTVIDGLNDAGYKTNKPGYVAHGEVIPLSSEIEGKERYFDNYRILAYDDDEEQEGIVNGLDEAASRGFTHFATVSTGSDMFNILVCRTDEVHELTSMGQEKMADMLLQLGSGGRLS